MRHGSLFSGVDCFSIALSQFGYETAWHSEVNEYCVQVLAKRWPEAEQVGDIKEFLYGHNDAEKYKVEILSGGFPCTDLSSAGKGAGLDGENSGLWVEYARVIDELRPELVLIENVPRLLRLHFDRLLNDLNDMGYDCEWDVISAASAGAPHLRERLWIIAYPQGSTGPWPRAMGEPKKSIPLTMIIEEDIRWPRAGALRNGSIFELTPLVPRKTKRVDGKTYWVGRMLFGEGEQILIPSPRSTDGDRGGRGDLIQSVRGNSNGHFAQRIWEESDGVGMWPAPSTGLAAGGHVYGPEFCDQGGRRADGGKAQVNLAHYVEQVESGHWERPDTGLLPTPTAQDASNDGGPAQHRRKTPPLHSVAALLPTPEASDASGGRVAKELGGIRPSGAKRSITLGTAVAHMESDPLLPTPTRGDGERGSETFYRGEGNPTLLGAARLLPTPTATVIRGGRNATSGRSDQDSKHHAGETLTDLAFRGDLEGPLLPTPAAATYGSNQGGAAGRVGPVRHSLESMAKTGLWPTPSAADGRGGPGRSDKRTGGDNLRTAVSLWPSPVASWNENRGTTLGPAVQNGQRGQKLAEEVSEDEVPDGRPRGSLNPDWVEWMLGLPKGFTDIDCEQPIFYPFSHEPLPRVAQNIANRRQRLQAIGNGLVWWIPFWLLARLEANYGLPQGERS